MQATCSVSHIYHPRSRKTISFASAIAITKPIPAVDRDINATRPFRFKSRDQILLGNDHSPPATKIWLAESDAWTRFSRNSECDDRKSSFTSQPPSNGAKTRENEIGSEWKCVIICIDGLQEPWCKLQNVSRRDIQDIAFWSSLPPHHVDVKTSGLEGELRAILAEKSVCHGTFTLASGAQSDFYVDAKLTTSDPRAALLVGRVGWELLKQTAKAEGIRVDGIGGLTMGADWVALSVGIAAHLDSPAGDLQIFSVRKEAKKHGRNKLIEGNFSAGDSVVIVDDVITKGGSTLQAIEAIEAAGGTIAFVIVLVDREEGGRENIEQHGYTVVPIFTRTDLVGTHAARRSDIAVAWRDIGELS